MSAKVQVDKYHAALKRLVDRGDPISNDAVALEAGSGRGSIKKSRSAYTSLIADIEAAEKKRLEQRSAADPVPALQVRVDLLTRRLDQSLERELSLLNEVYSLREELRQARIGRPVAVKPSKRRPNDMDK